MMRRHKPLLLEPLETRSLFAVDLQGIWSVDSTEELACDAHISSDLSKSFSDAFASSRSIDRLNEQFDFLGPTRHSSNGRSIRSDFEREFFASDISDSSFQIEISPPQKYSVVVIVDAPAVNSTLVSLIGLSSSLQHEAVLPSVSPAATHAPTSQTLASPTLSVARNAPTTNSTVAGNNPANNAVASGNSLLNRPNELRPSQRFASVQPASLRIAIPEGESDLKNIQTSTPVGIGEKLSVNSSDSFVDALVDSSERPWASIDRQRVFALYGMEEIESIAVIDMLPLEWGDSSGKTPRTLIGQESVNSVLDVSEELDFDLASSSLRTHSRSLSFPENQNSSRLSHLSSDRLLIPADMVFLDLNDRDQIRHEDAVALLGRDQNQETVLQSGLSPMAIFQIFINEDPLNASTPFVIPSLDFTLHDASNKQHDASTDPTEMHLNAFSSVGAAVLTTVTIVGVTNYIREYNRLQWKQANLGLANGERSSLSFLRNFPK